MVHQTNATRVHLAFTCYKSLRERYVRRSHSRPSLGLSIPDAFPLKCRSILICPTFSHPMSPYHSAISALRWSSKEKASSRMYLLLVTSCCMRSEERRVGKECSCELWGFDLK